MRKLSSIIQQLKSDVCHTVFQVLHAVTKVGRHLFGPALAEPSKSLLRFVYWQGVPQLRVGQCINRQKVYMRVSVLTADYRSFTQVAPSCVPHA